MDKSYLDVFGKVILRKEKFGGLIYIRERNTFLKLNKDAYSLFKRLFLGESLDDLVYNDINLKNKLSKLVSDFPNTFGIVKRPFKYNKNVKIVELPDIGNYELSSPILAGIELCKSCTFSCPHCYSQSGPSRHEKISQENFEIFLKETEEAGIPTVYISGGEPFSHPDLLNFLKMSMDGFDHTVLISTNGYILREEILDFIKEYKDRIGLQVSIDHPNQNINKKTRNKYDSFYKAHKTLRAIIERDISVSIGCVITKYNIDSIDLLVDYVNSMGVDELHLMPLAPSGRGLKNFFKLYPSKEKLIELYYKLELLKDKYPILNIICGNFLYQPNFGKPSNNLLEGYEPGFTQVYVGFNLDIYPGDLLMNKEFKCGNLKENKLWVVWQESPVLESIRNFEYIPKACKKCNFVNTCKGGDISFLNLGKEFKEKNLLCPHNPEKNEYFIIK